MGLPEVIVRQWAELSDEQIDALSINEGIIEGIIADACVRIADDWDAEDRGFTVVAWRLPAADRPMKERWPPGTGP